MTKKRLNKSAKPVPGEHSKPWDPTPDEIAEACRRIRDAWSDWEFVKRAGGGRPEPFRVPHVIYTPHGSIESSET